jgi:hypothetical protein
VEQVGLDPTVWGTIFPELAKTRPASPILGFRINHIRFSDPWRKDIVGLTGIGPRTYFWEAGTNTARCVRPGIGYQKKHQVPGSGCGCGFYAFHDFRAFNWSPSHNPGEFVFAGIAGSGIVRVHERGWRAQYARIVAFSYEMPCLERPCDYGLESHKAIGRKIARELEARYEVPVVSLKQIRDTMLEVGHFVEAKP